MTTNEDYITITEGQTFDRKSARIEPKALAVIMVALANADGGTLMLGIEDDDSVFGIDGFIIGRGCLAESCFQARCFNRALFFSNKSV